MTSTEGTTISAAAGLPDGATCWLCLEEEGPDESGAPLVRDCSCRGSSGFAHLECIVSYAESEAKRIFEKRGPLACMKPFNICPNCKQDYQNQLRKDISKASIDFVETEFEENSFPRDYLSVTALVKHLTTLDGRDEDDRRLVEEMILKFSSAFDRLKASLGERYSNFGLDVIEPNCYANIAAFYLELGSDDGRMKAKDFFEKARDLFNKLSTNEAGISVKAIEQMISKLEAELSGDVTTSRKFDVSIIQTKYNCCVEQRGQNSSMTILMGIDLAYGLRSEYKTIEAERLLNKLVDVSRRTHGPDHQCTVESLSALQIVRERKVVVRSKGVSGFMQALRYENGGEECAVKGPMAVPRNVDEEEEWSVDSVYVIPFPGTPVVCHGLKNAKHLNGMIGDVRSLDVKEKEDGSKYFDKDIDRCVVHFEDKSFKPAKVKATNLRVLFDLPNADDD